MTPHGNFIDAHLVANLKSVLICRRCLALIFPAHAQAHNAWHERLRRAVDETEMLESNEADSLCQ
jgi:hypothetical protein